MDLLRRLEERARAALPAAVYDYYAGGAADELTAAANERAWRELSLHPRVLTGVASADTGVELLGRGLATPILLAPVAAQRLAHTDGELASARAAAAAGTVFCVSTRATADLAEVAAAAPGAALWFQLYVQTNRSASERVLRRAAEHGYEAIVLTVDLPVGGLREREFAHGEIPLPEGVTIATHTGEVGAGASKPQSGGWRADLGWPDIAWAGEASGLPVVVKGVLTAPDAVLAIEHGAAAIVVSNHGGRALDGVVPTAVALPEVVAAVAGRVPVLADGGLRSGADVVAALTLGAAAVLIGRPYVWGLAAAGEEGVRNVLDVLTEDTAEVLVALGAPTLSAVRKS